MHNEIDINNYCRVCGLDQEEPPWGEDGTCPTYGICFCCGTEFGYHDFTIESLRAQRKKWLGNGAQWRDQEEKPENWSLEEQMKNIPEEFL